MKTEPITIGPIVLDVDYCYTVRVTTCATAWHQQETGAPGWLDFSIYQRMYGVTGGDVGYADADCQPTSEITAAFPIAQGSVKWDGCVNWESNPGCMVHSCGLSDVESFGRALALAYQTCTEAIVPADLR